MERTGDIPQQPTGFSNRVPFEQGAVSSSEQNIPENSSVTDIGFFERLEANLQRGQDTPLKGLTLREEMEARLDQAEDDTDIQAVLDDIQQRIQGGFNTEKLFFLGAEEDGAQCLSAAIRELHTAKIMTLDNMTALFTLAEKIRPRDILIILGLLRSTTGQATNQATDRAQRNFDTICVQLNAEGLNELLDFTDELVDRQIAGEAMDPKKVQEDFEVTFQEVIQEQMPIPDTIRKFLTEKENVSDDTEITHTGPTPGKCSIL